MAIARPPRLNLTGHALFLDLDGTLAPIAPRPQDVGPEPRRTQILTRLGAAMDGRLAVLSGRTLAEIDHILEGAVTPVAAVHGLDRRTPDGTYRPASPDPQLVVEEKGLSAALHYRLAPHQEAAARALAQDLAGETGLTLQPGHMVVELRSPGPDKGDSLDDFMALPPFAGAAPVFLGDDLTDEPAFQAAARRGGFGVLVGPVRNTAARFRLEHVDAVLDWLEAAL
ncbi:MAG TPA: trehalose-phosphatase [Phenylobacterium sp.]|nr:trehalose-phosphatase [Phenylobacterium sp.]